MAIKDQAEKVQYTAYDTSNNVGKTGDSGNHSLSLRLNGATDSSLDNSPSELANGEYEIQLTAAELAAEGSATLFGESSTSDIVIIPTRFYVYDAATFKATSITVSDKTGFKLASDGLDSITATAPGGVASNVAEMLVQLWRRFFKKSTMTTTQLKTYADDGSTPETTQAISDDGTTQTQGASS